MGGGPYDSQIDQQQQARLFAVGKDGIRHCVTRFSPLLLSSEREQQVNVFLNICVAKAKSRENVHPINEFFLNKRGNVLKFGRNL